MEKSLDEAVKSLIDSGKRTGYLTYSQINEALPEDLSNPDKLDEFLLVFEEHGIELIDDPEGETRPRDAAQEATPAVVADEDEEFSVLNLQIELVHGWCGCSRVNTGCVDT